MRKYSYFENISWSRKTRSYARMASVIKWRPNTIFWLLKNLSIYERDRLNWSKSRKKLGLAVTFLPQKGTLLHSSAYNPWLDVSFHKHHRLNFIYSLDELMYNQTHKLFMRLGLEAWIRQMIRLNANGHQLSKVHLCQACTLTII